MATETTSRIAYEMRRVRLNRPAPTARRDPAATVVSVDLEADVVIGSAAVRRDGAFGVPAQDEALVQQRDDETGQEQDHRKRAAIAELVATEAGLEHRDRHRARGVD